MSLDEIEIEIGPTGQVTVRTKGIKGPRCIDVAETIAKIVGQIESRHLTCEYYEASGEIRHSINVRERH
jgi:Protein of unknown function (DUF2997)